MGGYNSNSPSLFCKTANEILMVPGAIIFPLAIFGEFEGIELASFFLFLIISALIGWIYGKIKSRK